MIFSRRNGLLTSFEVLKKYGVYFLSQSNTSFNLCVAVDHPGLYLYVPLISYYLHTDVMTGALIFFALLSMMLFSSYILLLWQLTRTSAIFYIGLLWTAYTAYKIYLTNDVYVVVAWALFPLSFLLIALHKKSKTWWLIGSFFVGLVTLPAHIVRFYSCVPLLFFFFWMLLFIPFLTKKYKLISLLFFLGGFFGPFAHYRYVVHKKNTFLEEQHCNISKNQPYSFWHSIYIGFGFLRNLYKIRYADQCAFDAARSVNPTTFTGHQDYDSIVASLVYKLFKQDCHFFMISLFAKAGVVLMFFLVWWGWLGVLCSYWYPKPWYEEIAWWGLFALAAAPGILAIPRFEYLSGFIVGTVFYVLYSTLRACNHGMIAWLWSSMKKAYKGVVS